MQVYKNSNAYKRKKISGQICLQIVFRPVSKIQMIAGLTQEILSGSPDKEVTDFYQISFTLLQKQRRNKR